MATKKAKKAVRAAKTFLKIVGFGPTLLCVESYLTVRSRVLDSKDFIEVTDFAKSKYLINKIKVIMVGKAEEGMEQ